MASSQRTVSLKLSFCPLNTYQKKCTQLCREAREQLVSGDEIDDADLDCSPSKKKMNELQALNQKGSSKSSHED